LAKPHLFLFLTGASNQPRFALNNIATRKTRCLPPRPRLLLSPHNRSRCRRSCLIANPPSSLRSLESPHPELRFPNNVPVISCFSGISIWIRIAPQPVQQINHAHNAAENQQP